VAQPGRTTIVYLAVALVFVIIFLPVPQIVAPDWTVKILDASHRPLPGVTVREVWQHYSVEDSSHEEDRLTDNQGKVHFPLRRRWVSIAVRLLGCSRQIIGAGVHASCGAHSFLVAFGRGIDTMDWEDLRQEDGTTMPWQSSTLVLKH
jgi:hypothetical protein